MVAKALIDGGNRSADRRQRADLLLVGVIALTGVVVRGSAVEMILGMLLTEIRLVWMLLVEMKLDMILVVA